MALDLRTHFTGDLRNAKVLEIFLWTLIQKVAMEGGRVVVFWAKSTFPSGLNIFLRENMQPLMQPHITLSTLTWLEARVGEPTQWPIHIYNMLTTKRSQKMCIQSMLKKAFGTPRTW